MLLILFFGITFPVLTSTIDAMKFLRLLLFPFTLLYALATYMRNLLYDLGLKKSTSFSLPLITVGNLSVGGTGKSPMVEYLIRLLEPKYQLATLSRGYKRKSKGFLLASESSNAIVLGDEPYQYYTKFKNLHVAVDADRVAGVKQLLAQLPHLEVVILDDAFQHRKIQAGFSLLLTSYNDLYVDDFLLLTGHLREGRKGAKRAQVIVVTKCPENLSLEAQTKIITKLQPKAEQHVFFSTISYDDFLFNEYGQKLRLKDILPQHIFAVAGIAKPSYFFNQLQVLPENTMTFADHYAFTSQDVELISQKSQGKILITTEKDYMRLKDLARHLPLYFLPIQTRLLNKENEFAQLIFDYVSSQSSSQKF